MQASVLFVCLFVCCQLTCSTTHNTCGSRPQTRATADHPRAQTQKKEKSKGCRWWFCSECSDDKEEEEEVPLEWRWSWVDDKDLQAPARIPTLPAHGPSSAAMSSSRLDERQQQQLRRANPAVALKANEYTAASNDRHRSSSRSDELPSSCTLQQQLGTALDVLHSPTGPNLFDAHSSCTYTLCLGSNTPLVFSILFQQPLAMDLMLLTISNLAKKHTVHTLSVCFSLSLSLSPQKKTFGIHQQTNRQSCNFKNRKGPQPSFPN
jgi:hypothetical protein